MLPNPTEVQSTKRFVNDTLVAEKYKYTVDKSTPSKWENSPQRDVPTRITFNGDPSLCKEALKPAQKFLGKMKNAVRISKGNIKQLWSQIQTLPTGQQFICSVEHNFSKIEIFAGGGGAVKKHIYYNCYCDCSFSLGFIVEKTTSIDGLVPTYTVAICGGKGLYNIFENIIASDFTKYVEDQKVLVMAYNAAGFECCIASGVSPMLATGCNPIVSAESIDSDYWRTTYRIVPFCAVTIPKWEKTGETEEVDYGNV